MVWGYKIGQSTDRISGEEEESATVGTPRESPKCPRVCAERCEAVRAWAPAFFCDFPDRILYRARGPTFAPGRTIFSRPMRNHIDISGGKPFLLDCENCTPRGCSEFYNRIPENLPKTANKHTDIGEESYAVAHTRRNENTGFRPPLLDP